MSNHVRRSEGSVSAHLQDTILEVLRADARVTGALGRWSVSELREAVDDIEEHPHSYGVAPRRNRDAYVRQALSRLISAGHVERRLGGGIGGLRDGVQTFRLTSSGLGED